MYIGAPKKTSAGANLDSGKTSIPAAAWIPGCRAAGKSPTEFMEMPRARAVLTRGGVRRWTLLLDILFCVLVVESHIDFDFDDATVVVVCRIDWIDAVSISAGECDC